MMIIYSYFLYNSIYLIIFSDESLLMSKFFNTFQNFQLNIINSFNIYRQLLFDEESYADITLFEILDNRRLNCYNTITGDVVFIQKYINKYVPITKKVIEIANKTLCSYIATDYFESIDECNIKYQNILKYDFIIFSTCFIEEIRIQKNILKYLLSSGTVRGQLISYFK